MTNPLTIVIPTFNRINYLSKLTKFLSNEEYLYKENLNVIILNNCSEDDTKKHLEDLSKQKPHWKFINNEVNIGSDANMVKGIQNVKTNYCWIIGDDDLPLSGTIHSILENLKRIEIGLIYISPYWTKNIYDIKTKSKINSYQKISNYNLAKKVHVLTTFISSWIFNVDILKKNDPELNFIKGNIGTYFSQLSWILPLLSNNECDFYISNGDYILATTGNTHPYKVLESFLFSFPEIVNKLLDDAKLIDIIIKNYCLRYLPRLIFSVNTGVFFHTTDAKKKVKISKYLLKYPEYQFICKPTFLLSKFTPIYLARFFSKLFRLIKKLNFKSK
tara:strand:+ start:55 stop:1047 length:993 start_codon:yes stop_codon:yes gene_type:complete